MYEAYSPRPVPSPGGLVVANGSVRVEGVLQQIDEDL
jgi:hypothetical protein